MHTVYVENEFGDQFKFTMVSDYGLDLMFDNLNIVRPKYIPAEEFCETDLITADLADPETGMIIGHMTFNKDLFQ